METNLIAPILPPPGPGRETQSSLAAGSSKAALTGPGRGFNSLVTGQGTGTGGRVAMSLTGGKPEQGNSLAVGGGVPEVGASLGGVAAPVAPVASAADQAVPAVMDAAAPELEQIEDVLVVPGGQATPAAPPQAAAGTAGSELSMMGLDAGNAPALPGTPPQPGSILDDEGKVASPAPSARPQETPTAVVRGAASGGQSDRPMLPAGRTVPIAGGPRAEPAPGGLITTPEPAGPPLPTLASSAAPDVPSTLMQMPAQSVSSPVAAGAAAAHQARTAAMEAPAGQLFVRIEQAAAEGQTRFAVRLDPEELGRVEVVLEFQDGRVQATVAADRPATLELLQRDARWLERAMEQGGFKLQQDGLHFTLRNGQAGAGQEGGQRTARLLAAGFDGADSRDDMLVPAAARRLEGLVDIQV